MSDLKGTLDAFASRLYGEGITTRFPPLVSSRSRNRLPRST